MMRKRRVRGNCFFGVDLFEFSCDVQQASAASGEQLHVPFADASMTIFPSELQMHVTFADVTALDMPGEPASKKAKQDSIVRVPIHCVERSQVQKSHERR